MKKSLVIITCCFYVLFTNAFAQTFCVNNNTDTEFKIVIQAGFCHSMKVPSGQQNACYQPGTLCQGNDRVDVYQVKSSASAAPLTELCHSVVTVTKTKSPSLTITGNNGKYSCSWQS